MTKGKSFVLHDETLNTYGFRMLTSGADITEFKKNPVMLLNHEDWTLPIGRWENIRKEDGRILADPVFDLKDERAQTVAQKVEDNFLRAASIGAWPPIEISEAADDMLPGQKRPTITKWKVREASIVTLGANHNALVFYDGKGQKMELTDAANIIKLFDASSASGNLAKPNFKTDMNKFNKLLNLADNATDSEREAALQALLDSNVELTDRNAELRQKVEDFERQKVDEQKANAIVLTDVAIKDGRIVADAKERFLKLFDADFENAKSILESLPKRKSVTEQINRENDGTELSDMQKASWDELDKSGMLIKLKDKYPDLYAQKFETKFGTKPNN